MGRVGFFGGSFDPPHVGHIAVAKAAADEFGLEQVLLAPSGRQPLKVGLPATAFEDRLAMVELACGEDARFAASAVDAPRADGVPNFTVDTLGRLRGEMPGVEVFSVVGMDSFLDMRRWQDARRLLEMAEWVVVTRPGYRVDASLPQMGLGAEEWDRVKGRVHMLEGVHVDLSATGLRERLRMGEECGGLVPAAVLGYIRAAGLYRTA